MNCLRISACLLLLVFLTLPKIYGQDKSKTPTPNAVVVGGGGDGGGGDGGDGGGGSGLPPCNTMSAPTILWTSVGPDLSAGWSNVGADSYTLFYRPQGTSNFTAGCNGGTSCTIVSPPSGVTYELYVAASRACQTPGAGQSTDGKSSSIFALTIPISIPVGLNSTSVTPNSFTANWGICNAVTNYQIDVNTSSNFLGTIILSTNNGTVTNRNVTGLAPNTTYYYHVRASNAAGTSAWSQVATVTTQPLPIPAIPVSIFKNGATTTSMNLGWTASAWADNYKVDLSTKSDFSDFVYQNLQTNTASTTLSGLTPGTVYYSRIRATNATGTSANSSTFVFATLPLAPANLTISSITASTFNFGWTVSAGASGYIADVATTSNFAPGTTVISNFALAGNTVPLTGLTAGTTYYARVIAVNASGNSTVATTSAPTLPATPTNAGSSNVTATSFNATWQKTGVVDHSYVDVSMSSSFGSFVYQNLDAGTASSLTINELSGGTTYYFRVRASNSSGASGNLISSSVVTLLAPPANLALTSVTPASFNLSWSASTGITGYQIDVSRDLNFVQNNVLTNVTLDAAATTYSVGSLSAGLTYYVRLRAVKGTVISSNANATVILPPSAPTGVTASSPTLNSFTANWQRSNGNVDHYFVDIAETRHFNPILILGIDAQTNTQKTIDGLTNGKTYYFRIRARNAGGVSISDTTSVTLQAMQVPTELLTSSITSTSFNLFWSPIGGATSYEVNISADSTFTTVTTSTTAIDSIIFTGLSAVTSYYCRVRSIGVGGPSAWSERLTVVMSPVLTTISVFEDYFVGSSTDVGAQAVYYFEVSKSPQFASHVEHFEGTQPNSSNILTTYGLESSQDYYVRSSVMFNHVVSGYSNVEHVLTANGTIRTVSSPDQQPFNFNMLPPSPEAQALAKYADIPVSLYSGTPSISIPLYELKERSLRLPISLSYHGSGNKVEQVATRTGLGWTLNAGGVVTRVVRGWPDEHPARGFLVLRTQFSKVSDIVTLPNTSETKFEVYDAMANDCKDGEPDLFYFNFGGYSGQFMYDWDGNIKVVSGNSIKIESLGIDDGYYFSGWRITVDDGTQYVFSVKEYSHVVSNPHPTPGCQFLQELNAKQMPQSWFLSDISSADALDGIHFEYEGYTQFTETDGMMTQVYDLYKFQNGAPLDPTHYKVKTSYSGNNLSKITTTSGQTVINFEHASQARTDVYSDDKSTPGLNSNYPLGRIRVTNAGNKPVISWDLGYSYATGRLTLESVTETTGAVAQPPYKFTYDGSIPTDINSTQIDHWGFYNSNPGPLFPATAVHIPFTPQDEKQPLDGGDRSPNPDRVHAGMLKEITYPTGGKDALTFESHDYSFEQEQPLTITDFTQKAASTSAPVNGSGGVSRTFVLSEETDLTLNYEFDFAGANTNYTHFGGGTKNPAVYLYYNDGNRMIELFHLIPSINSDNFGSGSKVIYQAAPGTYTIKAVGYDNVRYTDDQGITHSNGENSAEIDVEWNEPVGPPRPEIRIGGGVRIRQIVRSFNNGNPDKVTRYNYTMVEDGKAKSSGSLLELVQMYEMYMQYAKPCDVAPNSNCYDLEDRYLRFSRNRAALGTTQGSHVGYSQVTVFEGTNGENGKSIYHYNSPREVGDDISLDIPFPPAQSFDFERGLLLDETLFNANGDTVRFVKNSYSFPNNHDISGLKVGWRYPGAGPTGSGDHLMERYAPGPYVNSFGYSRLTQTREKLFNPGAPTIETVTSFSYNEDTHKQLTQQSVVNSKGETFVTSHKYPLDYSAPSAPISVLQGAHMDNVPVETLTWKTGSNSQVFLLDGLKTDFVIDHAGNSALPQTKYSAKITDPVATSDPFGTANTLYEPRLNIGNYDSFNNPLESSKPDGKKTGYQWGYNSTLLVAAADHTSSANMFYEGFEEDESAITSDQKTGKKSKALNGSTYSIPRLPITNGDYILTYWVKEGSAWTYKEKQFNGYTAGSIATDAVNGLLDEVRLHPIGALMTTYTYEPLVGMTSVTDAANMTTYYEYDDVGRLAFVKDNDGNIIQNIDYKFNAPVPYRPISDQ